jgi:hypothetical protein
MVMITKRIDRTDVRAAGAHVEEWRQALGYTSVAMARELGATYQNIRSAETGFLIMRTAENIFRLMAQVLGVPYENLVSNSPTDAGMEEILAAAKEHVVQRRESLATSIKELA